MDFYHVLPCFRWLLSGLIRQRRSAFPWIHLRTSCDLSYRTLFPLGICFRQYDLIRPRFKLRVCPVPYFEGLRWLRPLFLDLISYSGTTSETPTPLMGTLISGLSGSELWITRFVLFAPMLFGWNRILQYSSSWGRMKILGLGLME